jgi:hypothetical protein
MEHGCTIGSLFLAVALGGPLLPVFQMVLRPGIPFY